MNNKTQEPEEIYLKLHTPDVISYWNLVKEATDEIKLKLISLLSLSLTAKKTDNKNEDQIIDSIYGSWSGSETAEEIIEKIKAHPSCKEPPIL